MWKFASHVPGSVKDSHATVLGSSSDGSDEGIADWSRTVALEDAEDLITYSNGDVSIY